MPVDFRRTDMFIDPSPGIAGETVFPLVLPVVVVEIVVMPMLAFMTDVMIAFSVLVVIVRAEMVAVHVDSAVVIRVRLVNKRAADRPARVAERDGKSAFALHYLGHRVAAAEVRCCSRCGAFTTTDRDPCDLCSDATRDGGRVCVVEDPADIISIEASGAFRGRYHALGGKLAPARHVGPGRLRLAELQERVVREGFSEVLLALSTDMDGDATAGYIAEMLKGTGAKVTRLAFGLPTDSGVAYSDPLTLKRAINGRQPLNLV